MMKMQFNYIKIFRSNFHINTIFTVITSYKLKTYIFGNSLNVQYGTFQIKFLFLPLHQMHFIQHLILLNYQKKFSEGHSFTGTATNSWVQSARKNVNREKMQNSKRAGKNSSQEALGRHKAQKGSVGEGHTWDRKQWDTKDGVLFCSVLPQSGCSHSVVHTQAHQAM